MKEVRHSKFINILDNDLSTSFLNEKRTSILIQLMKCYFPGVNFELMKTHLSFDDLNIDRRNNYYLQFNAGQVIEKLKSKVPKKGLLIVGVTMSDIYPRDEWNFVYGLANCMDGVGVFSFRRHYDELVEERLSNELSIEESDIEMLVCKKAAFTMIHETGHLFGIKHCIYYNCLMNGHNHSLEKSVHFYCPVCLRKLSWNLKFNVKEGYSLMLEGYLDLSIKYNNKTDFNEEIEWLKKRITLLN